MNKRPSPSNADYSGGIKRIKTNDLCPLDVHKLKVRVAANIPSDVAAAFPTGMYLSNAHTSANASAEFYQQKNKMNAIRMISSDKQPVIHITPTSSISRSSSSTSDKTTSPQSYLLQRFGATSFTPSLSMKNFFIEHTEEQIKAYDMQVIQAIRSQDIEQLRQMHKSGRQLQCANKFGESLIHMACRRGFVDVVRFLVDEAGVSVRVRDDYGRTVLHDACWTSEPNEELVEYLVRQCPKLLLMSDKRGNAPFEYARRENWGQWVKFLVQKEESFEHIAVVG